MFAGTYVIRGAKITEIDIFSPFSAFDSENACSLHFYQAFLLHFCIVVASKVPVTRNDF